MTASVEERPLQAAEEAEPKVAAPTDEYASYEDLLGKGARERDYELRTPSGKVLKLKLRAIGHLQYDQLVSQAEPTPDQQRQGLRYDDNVFGPKLIAAVVQRPRMDLDRASRLWSDPNWAGGEIGALYRACVELCQADKLDVPFTARG